MNFSKSLLIGLLLISVMILPVAYGKDPIQGILTITFNKGVPRPEIALFLRSHALRLIEASDDSEKVYTVRAPRTGIDPHLLQELNSHPFIKNVEVEPDLQPIGRH